MLRAENFGSVVISDGREGTGVVFTNPKTPLRKFDCHRREQARPSHVDAEVRVSLCAGGEDLVVGDQHVLVEDLDLTIVRERSGDCLIQCQNRGLGRRAARRRRSTCSLGFLSTKGRRGHEKQHDRQR